MNNIFLRKKSRSCKRNPTTRYCKIEKIDLIRIEKVLQVLQITSRRWEKSTDKDCLKKNLFKILQILQHLEENDENCNENI